MLQYYYICQQFISEEGHWGLQYWTIFLVVFYKPAGYGSLTFWMALDIIL